MYMQSLVIFLNEHFDNFQSFLISFYLLDHFLCQCGHRGNDCFSNRPPVCFVSVSIFFFFLTSLKVFLLVKKKLFSVNLRSANLTHSQKKTCFSCVSSTSFLKTLWEKEKLFSTLLENSLPDSSNSKSSSANSFILKECKICHLGKS